MSETHLMPLNALEPHERESGHVTYPELDFARRWMERVLRGVSPEFLDGFASVRWPFAFRLRGKNSDEFLETWRIENVTDSNGTTSGRRFQEPESGLRLFWQVRRFEDFPAVEWMLTFENVGETNTPLLEEIHALRLSLTHSRPGASYTIQGANGGRSLADDMIPFAWTLGDSRREVFLGGDHPSSNRHLPFFNLVTPEKKGVFIGVGWSGSWQARVSVEGNLLKATVGLKDARYFLKPGERLRTARILLLWWEGETLHAHNVWRRLLHVHYVPRLRGKLMEPLVSVNVCFTHHGRGGFLHQATEASVAPLVKPFAELGAELFIVDAGWYDGEPWHEWLGNWVYSKAKYPRGFRPISDSLAKADIPFGLWFAPENVSVSAPLLKEHPEWVRGRTLRMERPDAREWFLRQVDNLAQNEGMACYRQDGAGEYGAEPEDRQGISETEHITGLYALWDALRERYPTWVMEGCCGGGRRIDLETLSRFHWHQKSDRWYDSESDQCGLYGANLFLPGGCINVPTERMDNYGAWSSFAGQFCLGWHPLDPDFPKEKAAEQIRRYRSLRSRLQGDFYPLTPCSLDDPYIGYQFHRPDTGEGFALVFRRPREVFYPVGERFFVSLRGLEPTRRYRVRFEPESSERHETGASLKEGFELFFPEAPAVALVVYAPFDPLG